MRLAETGGDWPDCLLPLLNINDRLDNGKQKTTMVRDLQSELKKLHERHPEVGVVHNGKTALEWYTLYCAATAECDTLKKLERDRWTGWAKELGWTPSTRMIVCQKCGNKRCPRAGDEKHKCTGSNATGQIGEIDHSSPVI